MGRYKKFFITYDDIQAVTGLPSVNRYRRQVGSNPIILTYDDIQAVTGLSDNSLYQYRKRADLDPGDLEALVYFCSRHGLPHVIQGMFRSGCGGRPETAPKGTLERLLYFVCRHGKQDVIQNMFLIAVGHDLPFKPGLQGRDSQEFARQANERKTQARPAAKKSPRRRAKS